MTNPDFLPGDAMIAPDFSRQRVPATESIVIPLVEEARARRREKDKRGRIKRSLLWQYNEKTIIAYRQQTCLKQQQAPW